MKKTNFRKISSFILIILITFSNIANAIDIDYDNNYLYVTDKANILSEDTKEHIVKVNQGLKETGAEIAVLTIESLEGEDIKYLATKVFEDWKIGDKEKDNGVLILLSVEDRKIEVEIGYGLEGALPDSKVVNILKNDFAPYAEYNDFNEGIKNTFDSYTKEVMREYNIDSLENIEIKEETINLGEVLFRGILILILIFIIINISGGGPGGPRRRIYRTYPRRYPPTYRGGFGPGPFGGGSSGGFGGNSNGGFGGGRSGGGGGGIDF